MGMFDDIKCKYPLPVAGANDLDFQTKDTPAQWMDKYEIREDGTLWHQAYDVEDRSDKSAAPGSLERIVGICTSVNHRWEPCGLTGGIRFYTQTAGVNPVCNPTYGPRDVTPLGWIEFSSYFVKGQLKELHLLEHREAGTDRTPQTEQRE